MSSSRAKGLIVSFRFYIVQSTLVSLLPPKGGLLCVNLSHSWLMSLEMLD